MSSVVGANRLKSQQQWQLYNWIESTAKTGKFDGKACPEIAVMASKELGFDVSVSNVRKGVTVTGAVWKRGYASRAHPANPTVRLEDLNNVLKKISYAISNLDTTELNQLIIHNAARINKTKGE